MKNLILTLVTIFIGLTAFANASQTVTLHHGDEFKTFFSGSAFKKAMAEAQPGDIITLSPGSFKATDITVPVTIRGAGIGVKDDKDNAPDTRTILTEDFRINIPVDENGHTLSMEGIECSTVSIEYAVSAVFSKMRFKNIYTPDMADGNPAVLEDISFVHCIIDCICHSTDISISFFNSVIGRLDRRGGTVSLMFRNCIMTDSYDGGLDYTGITYINCIFNIEDGTIRYSNAFNCLWTGGKGGSLYWDDNSLPERKNAIFPPNEQAFIEDSYFRLTDQAAKYLGNDGTQVGIYGSTLPFTVKTSYPQIKKFVVSPESGSDGKLKIEIEIDE